MSVVTAPRSCVNAEPKTPEPGRTPAPAVAVAGFLRRALSAADPFEKVVATEVNAPEISLENAVEAAWMLSSN